MISEQKQIENLVVIAEWEYEYERAYQNKDSIKMLELMGKHGEILRLRKTLHGEVYFRSWKFFGR